MVPVEVTLHFKQEKSNTQTHQWDRTLENIEISVQWNSKSDEELQGFCLFI